MNERIQELYDKLGLDFKNFQRVTVTESDMQYFAQLIVKECEKVISDGRYSDMACEGNSHRVSYNNGRYGASLDVKKHFGVEE